jgi:hypothetical protein
VVGLPLRESFTLLRAIHRVEPAAHRERLDRCVEVLGLAEFLDVPVRQLSLGQRMRGEVTAALLHAPDCWSSTSRPSGSTGQQGAPALFLQEVNATGEVTILLTTARPGRRRTSLPAGRGDRPRHRGRRRLPRRPAHDVRGARELVVERSRRPRR